MVYYQVAIFFHPFFSLMKRLSFGLHLGNLITNLHRVISQLQLFLLDRMLELMHGAVMMQWYPLHHRVVVTSCYLGHTDYLFCFLLLVIWDQGQLFWQLRLLFSLTMPFWQHLMHL